MSRALGSTGIRSRRSSRVFLFVLMESVEARETPPEFEVGALLDEEVLPVLAPLKAAPEFLRVFAMSAKLTDFAAEEEGNLRRAGFEYG